MFDNLIWNVGGRGGDKQDKHLQDVAHDVFALPARSLERDDLADPPDPGGSTGGFI